MPGKLPPVGALERIYQALSEASFVKGLKSAAETDPRLQRAIEQGYNLDQPLFHGSTYSKPIDTLKSKRGSILFSGDPDIASLYTAYYDQPYIKRSRGQIIPMLTREPIYDTGKNLFSDMNPLEFLDELGLGGKTVDKINNALRDRNIKKINESFYKVEPYNEKYPVGVGYGRPWGFKDTTDPELPMEYIAEKRRRYLEALEEAQSSNPIEQNNMYRVFLEDPVINKIFAKEGVPTLKFKYPTTENAQPGVLHGLIHDLPPNIWQEDYFGNVYSGSPLQRYAYTTFNRGNVRSPWANFDPALVGKPGLMKYRGGLI